LISFEELLATYRTQIDPTDDGGQFGDRGFQYTTAIYFKNTEEQQLAEKSKQKLQEADTFDKDIAVQILPFSSFYDAEEEHQDFYKKETSYYNAYKK
jgi:peptide methionine sulfoxide reductase msrA/msrB